MLISAFMICISVTITKNNAFVDVKRLVSRVAFTNKSHDSIRCSASTLVISKIMKGKILFHLLVSHSDLNDFSFLRVSFSERGFCLSQAALRNTGFLKLYSSSKDGSPFCSVIVKFSQVLNSLLTRYLNTVNLRLILCQIGAHSLRCKFDNSDYAPLEYDYSYQLLAIRNQVFRPIARIVSSKRYLKILFTRLEFRLLSAEGDFWCQQLGKCFNYEQNDCCERLTPSLSIYPIAF